MNIKASLLEVISMPNAFSELSDGRWEITEGIATKLWFRLDQMDNLGKRRYIPESASTVTVSFQRSDSFTSGTATNLGITQTASQSIEKSASQNADDKSIWCINLTSTDSSTILSGSVNFTLNEPTNGTCEWVQNYAIKKNMTKAGF